MLRLVLMFGDEAQAVGGLFPGGSKGGVAAALEVVGDDVGGLSPGRPRGGRRVCGVACVVAVAAKSPVSLLLTVIDLVAVAAKSPVSLLMLPLLMLLPMVLLMHVCGVACVVAVAAKSPVFILLTVIDLVAVEVVDCVSCEAGPVDKSHITL